MSSRYLDPTNDVAFKKVFSDKEILKDFLNGVLHLENASQIIDLEYMPKEEIPDIGQGKRSIFDIKVTDQEGNKYIIEMQNRPEPNFLSRVQLYASHGFASQATRGDTSNEALMPLIVVVIVKKTVFPEEVPCISYHDTRESVTNNRYLSSLSYAFIELGKFSKTPEQLENIEDYWLHYLSDSSTTKSPPANAKDPQILRAYDAIERFNWNDAQYDAYFKAILLLNAEEEIYADKYEKGKKVGIKEGIKKGKEAGIKEGIKKGKAEGQHDKALAIAKNMKKEGITVELILKVTGLSFQEISDLQE